MEKLSFLNSWTSSLRLCRGPEKVATESKLPLFPARAHNVKVSVEPESQPVGEKARKMRRIRRGELWDPKNHLTNFRPQSAGAATQSRPNAVSPQDQRLLKKQQEEADPTPQQDVSYRKSAFVQSMQQKRSALQSSRPKNNFISQHNAAKQNGGERRERKSTNDRVIKSKGMSIIRAQLPRFRGDAHDRAESPESQHGAPQPILHSGPDRDSRGGASSNRDEKQNYPQNSDTNDWIRAPSQSEYDWDLEASSEALPSIELPLPIRRESGGPTATFYSGKTFQEAGASEELVQALAANNITRPSHIQAASLMAVREGSQHLALADHAGSGKTLAYLLPLVQLLREHERETGQRIARSRCPAVLVVLPTTELCAQVLRVAKALAKGGAPFRSIGVTGGYKKITQRNGLREGPDMVIGTPGRLLEFLKEEELRLEKCQAVVLDEVDVLLGDASMFQEQVDPVRDAAPESTRFLLVTASLPERTWPYLRQQFPGIRPVLGPGLHRPAPGSLEQLIDCSGGDDISEESGYARKAVALLQLLRDQNTSRTVVFCNKIGTCRKVENSIKRNLEAEVTVLPYHTAVAEDIRKGFLKKFLSEPREGERMVLVCTDRASRGVDTAASEHVVLFDFPRDPSEYVRRAGRTARGAGGRGVVSLLVLGRQVQLAKHILQRNEKGLPLHSIPAV